VEADAAETVTPVEDGAESLAETAAVEDAKVVEAET